MKTKYGPAGAFKSKREANWFANAMRSSGWRTETLRSSGPTIGGGYKKNAYYVQAIKKTSSAPSKTVHRKRTTQRRTGRSGGGYGYNIMGGGFDILSPGSGW